MQWGLVLSGGAAHGLCNGGVLSVLEREGLRPDCIGGASMGAIIGALYAFTESTDAMRELCETLTLWNVAKLSDNPLKDGLHGGLFRQRLREHLEDVVGDATIADCAIPFTVVAGRVLQPIAWTTIIRRGFTDEVLRCVAFHVFPPTTRLLDALMATSAIPVVFSPVEVDGDTYVDLVHFGAIPARTLREQFHPDIVIGTDTVPRYATIKKILPAPWKEFMERGYAELKRSKAACDLVITPEPPAGLFRFDKAKEFWAAGERAADDCLAQIRTLLN